MVCLQTSILHYATRWFVIRQAMRNDGLYLPSSLLYACLRGFLSAVLLYIPKWILDALLSNNSQSMGYIAFLLSVSQRQA